MKKRLIVVLILSVIMFFLGSFMASMDAIPRTWDMAAIKHFHLPPPDSTVKVEYASEEYYDAMPEHVIYQSYPVYLREFERPGYIDSLRQLDPEIIFDASKLKTPEDWIKAGEAVFNFPVAYNPVNGNVSPITAKAFEHSPARVTKDNAYGFSRYLITEKGKIMIGSLSCASCHTHILPSGEAIPGGPGNVFNNNGFAMAIRSGKIPYPILQESQRNLTYTPWAPDMPNMSENAEAFADLIQSAPAGVVDRQGGAHFYPLAVPSLIGVKEIKYLDRTGLMRHDGPGDMMRYAAFNQGMDMITSYNGFVPGGREKNTVVPKPEEWSHPFGYVGRKYTDAQLYALTQYIYSLQAPRNPQRSAKSLVARGEVVFKQAGCVSCHTPPLYTNNKLTPVNGFEPPRDHFSKYDIFNISVGTDSVTALYSRRGTGYYKVPSLRGVWYQDVFFHNGNLSTLEEVLDPRRLQSDFVPTGFKPPHVKSMAVKGHPFGMELSDTDKKALIAFLKTL